MDAYAAVYDKYLRFLLIAFPFRGESPMEEHQQLFDCALRRDATVEPVVLERHVNDCVDFAISRGCIPRLVLG